MLKQFFVLVLFSALLVSTSSCGSGGVDCDDEVAVTNAFTEGFAEVLAASLSFDADANEDNCQKLVEALDAWINDLEDFEVCAQEFGQGADFRESINEAKADISDLSCG